MDWREKIHNFDLGRLTLVGWLLFLFSGAVGLGVGIVADAWWDKLFPPPPGFKWRDKPAAFVGIAAALGFFFGAMWLLGRAGIALMRPKTGPPVEDELQEPALEEAHEIPAESLSVRPRPFINRPAQVVIGIVLLFLSVMFLALSTFPDRGANLATDQLGAALSGLLGLACVVSWGRPYTTRITMGVLTLFMIGMAVSAARSPKPQIGAMVFAAFVAALCGVYAFTGRDSLAVYYDSLASFAGIKSDRLDVQAMPGKPRRAPDRDAEDES